MIKLLNVLETNRKGMDKLCKRHFLSNPTINVVIPFTETVIDFNHFSISSHYKFSNFKIITELKRLINSVLRDQRVKSQKAMLSYFDCRLLCITSDDYWDSLHPLFKKLFCFTE